MGGVVVKFLNLKKHNTIEIFKVIPPPPLVVGYVLHVTCISM